jgi:hypothetical protein
MGEIQNLKETLEELIDDMLNRIHIIREYDSYFKLTNQKMDVFNSLIKDISIFYESVLIIGQYQNLNINIRKLSNILDKIYLYYETNLFLTFEIITVDFQEVLLEMKGTLHQCIH